VVSKNFPRLVFWDFRAKNQGTKRPNLLILLVFYRFKHPISLKNHDKPSHLLGQSFDFRSPALRFCGRVFFRFGMMLAYRRRSQQMRHDPKPWDDPNNETRSQPMGRNPRPWDTVSHVGRSQTMGHGPEQWDTVSNLVSGQFLFFETRSHATGHRLNNGKVQALIQQDGTQSYTVGR